MRSLPIFFAWVRTWRYRLSRAATPTVNRSATIAPCVGVCNTPGIVPVGFVACVGPSEALTLCVQFAGKRGSVEVVDEGALAVDLDHRQPLAVPRLELGDTADVHLLELELVRLPHLGERRPGALAEMAAVCVVDDDACHPSPARRGATAGGRSRASPGGSPPCRPVRHAQEGAHGGTVGSPKRLGIEPPRQRRLGDALGGEAVGGETHAEVARLVHVPGLRERLVDDLLELRVDLVLLPEVLLEALHPLEVRDDDAARV